MQSRLPLPYFAARDSYPWLVVSTVCIGAFMAALDASIVNVAMPTFLKHFHGGMHRIEWVSVAYLLTLTSLLTVFGRVSDMVGRRLMYSLGFIVFIIGSILCGAAPHLVYLIPARVIQAAGAAMLQANSVAIVTSAVSSKQRGKAIGIQGSAQAIGLSIGPAIGGLLISHWGWPSIFYVNVPVGLIGTLMGFLVLPRDQKQPKQSFDFIGAIILAPAFVFTLLTLTEVNEYGLLSSQILVYFAIAILLFVLLYFWIRKRENPIIDLSLFQKTAFTLGNVTGLLSFATMYGVLFLLPFYLENVQHLPPSATGFLLTPVPIAMAILTPFSGALADRFSTKWLTIVGMGLAAAGTLLFCFVSASTSFLYLIVGLVLVGIGQGVFTPPNNSSVMGSAPRQRLGVAGGILNMSRSLGMSFGIAFSGTIYQFFLGLKDDGTRHIAATRMLSSFHIAFLATALLGLCAVLIILVNKQQTAVRE